MFHVFVYSGMSANAFTNWTMIPADGVSGTEIESKPIATSITGNADTVDGQNFSYSNSSDSPTYLWATNSNGSSFLAARGNISVNYAQSAGNADTVDGYHASSLWRSDGGTWNPSANISLNASGNGQEWSFDIRRNGYTGCYWHVWDSQLSTMLRVNADDGKVSAPYGFVGNLSGTASSVTVNDSNSNSTYRMVWHSGNTLYSTAGIYCNPSTDTLYASAFYESSDIRLKQNIKRVLTSNDIPQIKEFDWKNTGKHSYGLIAQELESMGYSELVDTKDDGYKSVNYTAALCLIIGKLQLKIKELEDKIKSSSI